MSTGISPIKETHPLPCGWQWARLADICSTLSGGTPSRAVPTYFGGAIPWIKSGELNDGLISAVEERITEAGLANSNATLLPSGTLLIAMYGATVGKLGITTCQAATNQAICALFPTKALNRDFLFYWFLQKRNDLIEASFGGAQPNISQQTIRSLLLPLPPLPEQHCIAERLRDQLSCVERARAAAKAQLEAARCLSKSFLHAVFSSLGKTPTALLADVCSFLDARSVASFGDATVPVATTACLQELGFDPLGVKQARMWSSDLDASKLQQGEILVARSNTPELVGRVALYEGSPEPLYASDLTIRLKPKEECDAAFLAGYLSYLFVRGFWRNSAGGASGTMKKIRRSQLAVVQVPLLSLSHQKEIRTRFRQLTGTLRQVRETIREQKAAIRNLGSSLLQRAFSGELL